jgi:hypothetical protein
MILVGRRETGGPLFYFVVFGFSGWCVHGFGCSELREPRKRKSLSFSALDGEDQSEWIQGKNPNLFAKSGACRRLCELLIGVYRPRAARK